jgi:hypothetical protein
MMEIIKYLALFVSGLPDMEILFTFIVMQCNIVHFPGVIYLQLKGRSFPEAKITRNVRENESGRNNFCHPNTLTKPLESIELI